MGDFGVSNEKQEQLLTRMRRLGVVEQDIDEQFVHSSGRGGQNVNKVATCVCLIHRPSGIRVKCQAERQQGINRYRARCLLLDKIEQERELLRKAAVQEREKKRRQKRKRPQAVKEKILEKKRCRSERKRERQKIRDHKVADFF